MAFTINNRRYTGSKTKVLKWINDIIDNNCKDCHSFLDIFAGTGVVTNSVINKYDSIIINDFLYSNEVIYKAFFKNEEYDLSKIISYSERYKDINADELDDNYVSINYGNKYFEYNDSKKIGYIRQDIEDNRDVLNDKEYSILLASLLYSLDRSSNTVGHYEAYIKKNSIRSSFKYELIQPTRYEGEKQISIFRRDANSLCREVKADVVYIDPPYSSRQYSRFYHVLETITKWDMPELFGTAMKPKAENMSSYCSTKAIDSFAELIMNLNCRYILVSYNNTYNSKSKSSENKMKLEDMLDVLRRKGKTVQFSINHQAFNAGKTDLQDHKEIIFLTKVGEFDD